MGKDYFLTAEDWKGHGVFYALSNKMCVYFELPYCKYLVH